MALRLKNELLRNHTTFKIGGDAEIISIPDNIEDLISEINFCKRNSIIYRILGKGSNILADDNGVKGFIIKLNKCCDCLTLSDNDFVEVGAGVSIQKFIKFMVRNDLFGNENLFSIPGTVGGAIRMNAGIGPMSNILASISDLIISVTFFDGEIVRTISKKECNFEFRKSAFQKHKEWIILSAKFKAIFQDKVIGYKRINERMVSVLANQDRKRPNAGSIFNQDYSRFASFLMKGIRIGNAKFSNNNGNWIVNIGEASYKDVLMLIKIASFISSLILLRKPRLEIEIWR